MEDSMNSSMNKSVSWKGTSDGSEESGWTVYFEDFFTNNNNNNNNREYNHPSPTTSGFGTSSLVSDAASCADLKRTSKKLSFKKRRTIRVSHGGGDDGRYDDALEDTASSPINSPKISELRKIDMNPRKKDGNIHNFQNGAFGQCSQVQQSEERNHPLGFMGRETENECTKLKKRGLCLVPMSMLLNYIG